MRIGDILRLAFSAMLQQKVRTFLTLLGVAVGAFVLSASLSVGAGVQNVIVNEFRKHAELRQITLYGGGYTGPEGAEIPPKVLEIEGDMDDAKRERLRGMKRRKVFWQFQTRKMPITKERLQEVAQIDHVDSVVPNVQGMASAIFGNHIEEANLTGAQPDSEKWQDRLVAGRFLSAEDDHGVVVSEYLLFRWGITTDVDMERVLGKSFRLEFRGFRQSPQALLNLLHAGPEAMSVEESEVLDKVMQQLPAALGNLNLTAAEKTLLQNMIKKKRPATRWDKDFRMSEEFTIVGVLRIATEEEREKSNLPMAPYVDAEVILPHKTAEDLLAKNPYHQENGFDGAVVTVDSEDHVKEVDAKIKEMGFRRFSLVEMLEHVQRTARLISFTTAFVAAIALLVACLGITNTMLMTVLERTHEIGVMKAVGAKNRHIEAIFLVEGAVIGLIGGCLGLLLGWIASFPGDAAARSIMEKETQSSHLGQSVFIFPLWLTLGVPLFAALVTTVAAVYPSRRAAGINPITALRHE